jgi:deoxyribonuclease IV
MTRPRVARGRTAPRNRARAERAEVTAASASKRFLGAHVSVAGGLPRAFERGRALGCRAMQIFVKNASQWRGRPLDDEEVARFREAHGAWQGAPLVAHAAYLINLAAPAGDVRSRSIAGLADELERCARLGVAGLVVHPGAHGGAGEDEGVRRVALALDEALADSVPGPRVLLETTAGQGTSLGWRLEQLEAVIAASRHRERLAVCLDTCHLFAAGYAMDTAEGIDEVLAEARARFGEERIACVHLNDSRPPRGSRRDRHANLGEGCLGRGPFAHLVSHPRLAAVPLVVETPNDDEQGHARDLALLGSFLRKPVRRPRRAQSGC